MKDSISWHFWSLKTKQLNVGAHDNSLATQSNTLWGLKYVSHHDQMSLWVHIQTFSAV
jgi:hypothetical protein